MEQYVHYVADYILQMLHMDVLYGAENPVRLPQQADLTDLSGPVSPPQVSSTPTDTELEGTVPNEYSARILRKNYVFDDLLAEKRALGNKVLKHYDHKIKSARKEIAWLKEMMALLGIV